MAEEKKRPLTREDVLKLVEENGGKAEGLDLSGRTFVQAIDLSGLDLHGIILKDARFPTDFAGEQLVGAKFNGSDLNGADLRRIYFQYAQFRQLDNQSACLALVDLRGSTLLNTNFQGADLSGAKFGDVPKGNGYPATLEGTDLRGANLFRTTFKGCYFYATKLEGAYIRGADIFDAYLEEIDWGSYKIGEESKKEQLHSAESIYRRLKQWYINAGMYDVAGEFFFREMEAKRKGLAWRPQPRHRGWLNIYAFISGYGERPHRVIRWAAIWIFGLAGIYYLIGAEWSLSAVWNSIYFSMASFIALGYGSWVSMTNEWIKGIGALESFMGVFTIALFLVTFTRKMRR
jgi:uncharacterized protein YjbI with pentapeptide repeats